MNEAGLAQRIQDNEAMHFRCWCQVCGSIREALPPTIFQAQLAYVGACLDGRVWVGARSAKEAYLQCTEPSWLRWFLRKFAGWTTYYLTADDIRREVPWDRLRNLVSQRTGHTRPFPGHGKVPLGQPYSSPYLVARQRYCSPRPTQT